MDSEGADRSGRRPNLPVCTRCVHYRVTWDPARPHGCKAFGFKSKTNPALEVFRSSGVRCRSFRDRKTDCD